MATIVIEYAGLALVAIGLLLAVFPVHRMRTYIGKATGTVEGIETSHASSDWAMRITYSYAVDGVRYTKRAGWTDNGVFRAGGPCHVRYSPANPGKSYLRNSGEHIRILVGILFLAAGIFMVMTGLQLGRIM